MNFALAENIFEMHFYFVSVSSYLTVNAFSIAVYIFQTASVWCSKWQGGLSGRKVRT